MRSSKQMEALIVYFCYSSLICPAFLQVLALMGTDLVRNKERWAAGVKEMREVFGGLEAEGFSREAQQVWRQHWDFQLYKALEVQYCAGLEMVNKTLPEMDVKMVFRQHK